MALTKNDLIGIIVVPGLLALAFAVLAMYFIVRHTLIKIMTIFWKRKMCLSCQTEGCEGLMEDDNGHDTDGFITDGHQEKSVQHTLSVELSGSPCSGGDRSNKV